MEHNRAPFDRDQALRLAGRCAPGLRLDPYSARLVDDGWDYEVWLVDGSEDTSWALRFPRRREVADAFETELAVLRSVRDVTDVPLPDPRWLGVMPDGRQRFAISPQLRGEPVTAAALDSPAGPLLAAAIADVLVAVHLKAEPPPGTARYTPQRWREHQGDLVRRGREELRLGERLTSRWQARLDDDRLWSGNGYALVHRDLHPAHVLVDAEQGTVTGLLDWADACVADPAIDLAALLDSLGERAYGRVLAAYAAARGGLPPGFDTRARFYASLVPLHAALFGVDTGQEQVYAGGMAALRVQEGMAALRLPEG